MYNYSTWRLMKNLIYQVKNRTYIHTWWGLSLKQEQLYMFSQVFCTLHLELKTGDESKNWKVYYIIKYFLYIYITYIRWPRWRVNLVVMIMHVLKWHVKNMSYHMEALKSLITFSRIMLEIQLILQPNAYKLTWHPMWI